MTPYDNTVICCEMQMQFAQLDNDKKPQQQYQIFKDGLVGWLEYVTLAVEVYREAAEDYKPTDRRIPGLYAASVGFHTSQNKRPFTEKEMRETFISVLERCEGI